MKKCTFHFKNWYFLFLRLCNFTLVEPFSSESSECLDARMKQPELLSTLVISSGNVSTEKEKDYYQRQTYTHPRTITNQQHYANSSQVSIEFRKSSDLSAFGAFGYASSSAMSEPDIAVMMRGPGTGNPGGVVDDPVGSEHVLALFVLLYAVFIYRKRQKRLKSTSA